MPRHRPRYLGPTDDPVRDADRYLDDQMERSRSLPICYGCGEHITEEDAYMVLDHLYHTNCWEIAALELKHQCRVKTENYVGACWDGA